MCEKCKQLKEELQNTKQCLKWAEDDAKSYKFMTDSLLKLVERKYPMGSDTLNNKNCSRNSTIGIQKPVMKYNRNPFMRIVQ